MLGHFLEPLCKYVSLSFSKPYVFIRVGACAVVLVRRSESDMKGVNSPLPRCGLGIEFRSSSAYTC